MSTFGTLFRVTTFGESHCKGVGAIVDGASHQIQTKGFQMRRYAKNTLLLDAVCRFMPLATASYYQQRIVLMYSFQSLTYQKGLIVPLTFHHFCVAGCRRPTLHGADGGGHPAAADAAPPRPVSPDHASERDGQSDNHERHRAWAHARHAHWAVCAQ